MARKFFTSVLFLIVIYTVCYAQKGATENRSIGSFNAINVCCGIDLYITEGKSSTITVEVSDKEYLSHVKTEVRNGWLRLSFDNKDLRKKPNGLKIKVSVSASDLSAIEATSGSDVVSTTKLFANDIKVLANSGADIKIELDTKNLECDVSSGADIKLAGSALNAKVDASSGGDINMGEMTVKVARAHASSGSDIRLHVTDEIKANASSGGGIKYTGNPQTVNSGKSSGGSVRQIK